MTIVSVVIIELRGFVRSRGWHAIHDRAAECSIPTIIGSKGKLKFKEFSI